jgi:hypothetical protein
MSNKKETLQESFERVYGKTVLSKPGVKENSSSTIPVPIGILRFIVKFFFLGPTSIEVDLRPFYSALSGLFLSSSSILILLFINNVKSFFVDSFGWEGGFLTFIMAFVVVYSILQLLRGFAFIGGYNLFMSGYKASAATVLYGRRHNGSLDHSSTSSSKGEEIDEFLGYANSKMMWMSNENKEKYIKSIFGGDK